jgi:hypothetical protein
VKTIWLLGTVLLLAAAILIAPGGRGMHDKHGNAIQVGDVVRGTGYNVEHQVVGPVHAVSDGTSCNIHLVVPELTNPYSRPVYSHYLEHGAASDFEIVKTHDGRLLEQGPYAGYRSQNACLKAKNLIEAVATISIETPAPA